MFPLLDDLEDTLPFESADTYPLDLFELAVLPIFSLPVATWPNDGGAILIEGW